MLTESHLGLECQDPATHQVTLEAQQRSADYIACSLRYRGQPLGHRRCKEIMVYYFARVISCHVFGLLVTNSILAYLMDEAKLCLRLKKTVGCVSAF